MRQASRRGNCAGHALPACAGGRLSYQAGRIPKRLYATASSPWEGVVSYIPGE